MMEQYGVASAEEVKVENLADHLRIEITAAGTVCATPCCGRNSCCSTSHCSVSPPLVVQETFRILRTINRNGGVSMLLVRAERQHRPRTRRLRLSDRNGMHCHGRPRGHHRLRPRRAPCLSRLLRGKKCKASCTNCSPVSRMAAFTRAWRSRW